MGVRWYPCRAGIAGLAVLGMTLVAPRAVHSQEPLTRLTDVNGLRLQWPMQAPDGRLLGSQYDRTGNAFEIMQIDIESGVVTRRVGGMRDVRYLTENERYLVVQRRARLTQPLVLIDKASGAVVKELGIAHSVTAAYLEGNSLVAIQGGDFPTSAEFLVFEVPSLRVTTRTTLKGGLAQLLRWRDQFISVRPGGITLYDRTWNETGTLPVPPRDPKANVNCLLHSPLVHSDLFIVHAHCSQVLVYDLPTRTLRHSIATSPLVYQALAAIDGLLFSMPLGDIGGRYDDTRVYDLATARELATLPLNGNLLASSGKRLIIGTTNPVKISPLTIYTVDPAVLRSGAWRLQTVRAAFEVASRHAGAGDVHEALRLMDTAGVRGMDPDSTDQTARAILETYGVWLSRTLDQYDEGWARLERLQRTAPLSREGKLGLARAAYKRHVIERVPDALGRAQDLVRELFPGAAADAAVTRPATRPGTRLDLDFGAFPEGFVYMGDRIYVRRWSCGSHRGPNGVTVEVLDRETFAVRQSVPIVDCNDNYQDTVGEIREVDDLLLVWVNYRWESETRTDLVVLRRSDLTELGRVKAGLHGFDEARITPAALLLCVCGGQKLCKEIDRQSWQVTTISGEPAAQRCGKETPPFEEAFFRNTTFEATKQPGYPTTTVIFRRRESGDEIGRLVLHSAATSMATDDPDVIVVHDGSARGTHVVVVGLAPLRARLAMVLPHRSQRGALSTIYGHFVIVGYGRDLLVYDWRRSVVVAYFKEFIDGAARPSGVGLDRDQIVRLMVDRDRLVALTFAGMNSRLVPLEPLRRALAGVPDFFEPGPALLSENP